MTSLKGLVAPGPRQLTIRFSKDHWIYKGIRNATPLADQTYAQHLALGAQCTTTPDANQIYGPFSCMATMEQGDDARPLYIVPYPGHPRQPVFWSTALPTPPLGTRPTAWPSGQTMPNGNLDWSKSYMNNPTQDLSYDPACPITYDASKTYGVNDVVITTDGNGWYSLQAGNVAHTPASSPTWWGPVGTGGITMRQYFQQYPFQSVPVPLGADFLTAWYAWSGYSGKPLESVGTDHTMLIWDPWTDEYWEMFKFAAVNVNDTASGGSITPPSWPNQPGWANSTHMLPPAGYTLPADGWYYYFGEGAYAGAKVGLHPADLTDRVPCPPAGGTIGAAATDWPSVSGRVTPDDIMRGEIDHAIQFSTCCGGPGIIPPITRGDSTGFSAPVQSLMKTGQSGKDLTYQIPEGAIYRINPSWVLPTLGDRMNARDGSNNLKYPELVGAHISPSPFIDPIHLMIWKAMRDYGFYDGDTSSLYQLVFQGPAPMDTPYAHLKLADFNARMKQLAPNCWVSHNYAAAPGGIVTVAPGNQVVNPFYTGPWKPDKNGTLLIQQVTFPF